jgi:energy-coupling factor transporter ATP-binding protein EcfA2
MNDATLSTSLSAGAASPPMTARVARISVSDCRVFPPGPAFEFALGANGRNLLLFGENGSGKTSLFRAIRDLMATQPPPNDFADVRNFFAPGEEGFISVGLTAGSMGEIRWDYGNAHPRQTGGQPYALFAERCRFLDYRALLETNFVHRTPTPNLYRLLINDVLKDLPVIVSGKQDRLGSVHKRMLDARPSNHRSRRRLRSVDRACTDFSDTLTNHLPEVVKEGNEILSKLNQDGLAFDLHPEAIRYDRSNRSFAGEQIALSVTMFGQPIAEPQLFLNEARLTALALAIYFGAARLILKSLATAGDGTTPVRLLVLDDVLIGLDLANRLPVLKVINDEFAEWQILLFTYDHVWFDLARELTEHTGRWAYFSLRELPTTRAIPEGHSSSQRSTLWR